MPPYTNNSVKLQKYIDENEILNLSLESYKGQIVKLEA
jgi:hypothetical protein